jgi:hypothetical protein
MLKKKYIRINSSWNLNEDIKLIANLNKINIVPKPQ